MIPVRTMQVIYEDGSLAVWYNDYICDILSVVTTE